MEIARPHWWLYRRRAVAVMLFLLGSGFGVSAATDAVKGDDTDVLWKALFALFGIVSALVSLLSALVGKREKVVRSGLGLQVDALHKRVEGIDEHVTGHDRWIEAHDRRVDRLLAQQHDDKMSLQRQILASQEQTQANTDVVNRLAGQLNDFGEQLRLQNETMHNLIRLLQKSIDATPNKEKSQ